MVAFLYRMPSGIAGCYNRAEHLTVEAGILLAGSVPPTYGLPVAVDPTSGKYRAMRTTDTADDVAGFLVRPYPASSLGNTSDTFGLGAPDPRFTANILKRGYLMVTIGGTAAAPKGGTIYIRIGAPAAGKPMGGLEGAADGTNTIALPRTSYWMGPADAQGNSEIGFRIG